MSPPAPAVASAAQTIPALIADLAASHGDRVAAGDGRRQLTFAELDRQRRLAGRAMMALGMGPGERVALWAGNGLRWMVVALAIQSVGAVLIPLSTRLKGREVATVIGRAGASWLFCDAGHGHYDFAKAVLGEGVLPAERIVVLDAERASGPTYWPGFAALAERTSSGAFEAQARAIKGDDLADIIFTSGTTGVPKGVPMSHAQSLASCAAYGHVLGLTAADVFAVTFPFAHNAGYRSGWLTALVHGARTVVVSDTAPEALLSLLATEHVTYLPGVPTLHQGLLDCPRLAETDLSALRLTSTGATTIPVPLIQRMREGYGAAVITGYGLTEAAGTVSHCRIGDDDETVARTVGRPIPGMEVTILGADGRPAAPGQPGEVAIRGFTVARGYFEDPAATAEAFTADGFLRTGDVGVLDARGNLRITDRLKDMYIVGGFNCYPAEVEQQLCAMPGVAAAAVVGVPDARLGQVGRAFVTPAPGASLTEDAVIAWVRERLAGYKAPRRVVFVDALPLNATGKVAKDELRRRA